MKYVRCNFCDSGITIDQVRTFELNKVEGVKHDYVYFKCPACGYDVKSFIFNEEKLTSTNSRRCKLKLPPFGKRCTK